ncbi:right-handed parallel beta-helix repeat-containing protein, partial [Candidatus Kryptobacter tengchongensis]
MLRRMLIPLKFVENEQEFQVRTVDELIKFYNKDHLHELIFLLKKGLLEQFFYANGKDDIKNLIADLKNNGENELEILNQIALSLGVEPIELKNYEDVFFALPTHDPEVIFFSDASNIYLEPSQYEWIAAKIRVQKDKRINSLPENEVSLKLKNFELDIPKGVEIIFENLTIECWGETIFKGDGKVTFKNVKFSHFELKSDGIEIYFEDVVFEDKCLFNPKFKGGVVVFERCSGKAVVRNAVLVFNSTFRVKGFEMMFEVESSVEADLSFNLVKSIATITEAKIKGIGIYAESSDLEVKDLEMCCSRADGILLSSGSSLRGYGCKIWGNRLSGLRLINRSTAVIDYFDVYQNGNEKKDYPQILVEDSSLTIKNSKVHDSVNAGG